MTLVNADKKTAGVPQERSVSIQKSILPGYTYVRKGNVYVTRHCRARTLASGKPLYIVHAAGQPNKTLGLRVPSDIAAAVLAMAKATEGIRKAAVATKDQKAIGVAKTAIQRLYPKLTKDLVEVILNHGFAKKSGRVGRAGTIELEDRVRLAVQAHARHKHTRYDELLKTMGREAARKAVKKATDEVARNWIGKASGKKIQAWKSTVKKTQARKASATRMKMTPEDVLRRVSESARVSKPIERTSNRPVTRRAAAIARAMTFEET